MKTISSLHRTFSDLLQKLCSVRKTSGRKDIYAIALKNVVRELVLYTRSDAYYKYLQNQSKKIDNTVANPDTYNFYFESILLNYLSST
ncbi:hypothetical protein DSM107010_61470 [Chroococcidiopsis cubana SAG 39.79]|uniref:Uncharacterized protein n=1 Tax=Chroococcidiopsis cubana SAG 39.79 TaxID=388085 RepID=A0AB37UBA7_9CYAN|nr:hypothetical protein DSM107010_61470 [Chroococcidiopsis cubana SAG 39.79]